MPGAVDNAAKHGNLSLRFGLGWAKAQSFHTGQTPVAEDTIASSCRRSRTTGRRLPISSMPKVIPLEEAVQGYESFDHGAATKFVLDPYGEVAKAA